MTGKTPPRAYRPELDVLRFAAFFLVFFHHIFPRTPSRYAVGLGEGTREILAAVANMCGYGLCLFFLISGFLITDLLVREKAGTATLALKSFYIRRILRIWPLYFYAIGLGFLFLALSPGISDAVMLTTYLFMVGNWFFAYNNWSANPMTPLWSISVEEQFYLFWPVVIKYASRGSIFASCAALVAVAVVVEVWLAKHHSAVDTTIWTNSFVQFQNFAVGSALALYLDGSAPALRRRVRFALGAAGTALWFVSIYVFSAKSVTYASSATDLVIGLAMALVGTFAIFVALLGAPVGRYTLIVHLGKISFGLYAFHLMFIDLAKQLSFFVATSLGPQATATIFAVLSIAPTIWAADVSYRVFETPFLRLKQRFTLVASRPI